MDIKTKPAWMFVHEAIQGTIGYPGIVAELFFSSPEAFAKEWQRPLTKGEWLLEVTVPEEFTDWDFVPRDY